ncbi:NOT3 General negative regulator of transcription subunit 3 [Candida maltosa Xu316]
MLKEDLNKYLESNGDYGFTKETDLYDDIFNQIAVVDEDYSEIHDQDKVEEESESNNGNVLGGTSTRTNSSSPSPKVAKANGHFKESSVESNSSSSKSHQLPSVNTNLPSYQQQQQQNSTPVSTQPPVSRHSPEISSPAIVRTLKPATTPSKPVGNLKWSAAAAVGIPETVPEKTKSVESETNGVHETKQSSIPPSQKPQEQYPKSTPQESIQLENIDFDKYKEVIKNSTLSKTELGLFSDMNLVRVPPGIQDLVISFASKRYNDEFKVLVDSTEFNQYTLPLHKSYLPETVQPNYYSQFTNFNFRHPTQLTKFQGYWNQVRANFGFTKLADEIKSLTAQNNPEHLPAIAELTFVFFYGFYYGVTPAENLIAESYLFELGWYPYRTQLEGANNNDSPLSAPNGFNDKSKSNNYFYWFKRMKLISRGEEMGQSSNVEFGDYQVFDLSFWEIFVKYGFKFDYTLCQLEPSKSLF